MEPISEHSIRVCSLGNKEALFITGTGSYVLVRDDG